MGALHALTAVELAEGYRKQTFSVREVLDACLAQFDRLNPRLNAIISRDLTHMYAAADASDVRWRAGAALSELDGVPITIKDNLIMSGLPATWGSRLFEHFTPTCDELAVARLRQAGVVIVGKTNIPELGFAGYTDNELFGATGNPWDPELTPGGSSGGAVAAVMSGMAPLALATDAGGSIRRPAAHTGCIGLKPSVGRTPRRCGFPSLTHDFQSIGPIGRCVDDLAIMLGCLSSCPTPGQKQRFSGRTIGAIGKVSNYPVDHEISARFSNCLEFMRDLGADVREIDCPYDADEIGRIFVELAAAGIASAVTSMGRKDAKPGAQISRLCEKGYELRAPAYAKRLTEVGEFRWRMHDIFQTYDLLLTPAAPALPWPRTESHPDTIAGAPASRRSSAVFTTFANVGGLPGLSFPFGRSSTGMPIGMQLVGPHGSDDLLLALGREIESSLKWPRLAPIADADGWSFDDLDASNGSMTMT